MGEWWDDDDEYWELDDVVIPERLKPPTHDMPSAGQEFILFMEGLVYFIGALICGVGGYVGIKYYKEQTIPNLLPVEIVEDEAQTAMLGKARANVPITPDVHFT